MGYLPDYDDSCVERSSEVARTVQNVRAPVVGVGYVAAPHSTYRVHGKPWHTAKNGRCTCTCHDLLLFTGRIRFHCRLLRDRHRSPPRRGSGRGRRICSSCP